MVRNRVKIREARGVGKGSGLGLAIFILSSFASAGAQQPSAAPVMPSGANSKPTATALAISDARKAPVNDYTVSPEDLLDINVMDVPEVTRTYRVSSNGFLTLPLLPEPVAAAGETLDQLSHLIAAKFHDAGMLNNAQVSVTLKETRLHAILVSGEVKRPQAYPVYGPTRLLDILVQAGGLTDGAGSDAIIMRGDIGTRADLEASAQSGAANTAPRGQSFTLDIRKLVETGNDQTNILLYPGDRVTVQRAELIYIMGAVNHPGGYVLNESRRKVTVLKALAMAGDVNNVAKKSRITILRKDPAATEEKREEIPINYKAMVRGQIADVRLMPDDILFVPESSKLKAWRTSVGAAVQMTTMAGEGLMIYH